MHQVNFYINEKSLHKCSYLAGQQSAPNAAMDEKKRFMGATCGTRIRRRRIASGDANSHFDWDKAKMCPERMEEELAKLPSESDGEAIRSALENHNEKKHSCKDGRDDL